ncbi:MAG: hypothetical protein ACI3U2_10000, partial [Anaerovibrio sp.]
MKILWHGLPGRTYFFSIRHKRSASHLSFRSRLTPILLAAQAKLRLAKTPSIIAMQASGAAFPAEK